MVNVIRNSGLQYKAEDNETLGNLWAVEGFELIRDSRGIAIGRMGVRGFVPFMTNLRAKKDCEHDWESGGINESTVEREGDFIGFPSHCRLCGAECTEWFEYSYREMK